MTAQRRRVMSRHCQRLGSLQQMRPPPPIRVTPRLAILDRRVAFEELPKRLSRNYGVKADLEHLVSVTYKLQELVGRIHIEYEESSSYTGDDAGAFNLTRFHESLNHLTDKLP